MTEAMAAAEMSCLVRSRLSRMTGISGGAANVAKKAMKKERQLRWKQRWWGALKVQTFRTLDLQAHK